MKLNNTAYCHKQIRLLCYQLQTFTGLKLMTNLSEEFDEVRFMNELSYIVIDFERNACYTMSYAMDENEWQTVKDILLFTRWLYIGQNWERLAIIRARKEKRAKRAKSKKSSKRN